MNILAVGAHFDDVELGCGGTIAKHVKNADTLYVYVATNSGYTDYHQKVIRKPEIALEEGKKAAGILGVSELFCGNYPTNDLKFNDELTRNILKIISDYKIDWIYTHWVDDIHIDHQNLTRSVLTASRRVPRLFMYRSNFYDTNKYFHGNIYVDISQTIDIKKKAVEAHESEFSRIGEKWLRFFMNQNQNDGQKIGVDYAESFEVVKYLL
jgi:LmbE family N-acetylglucosaminyl deacetylase